MIRPLNEEVRSLLRSGVAITSLSQCVEELVLNSLDAGASCITVRLDVPNCRIQVADNGKGISFEDLRLIGERYTSSKCHFLEDLEQLTFYGFRGEALASIRDVCGVLEIITRHISCYKTYCKLFRDSKPSEVAESTFPRTRTGTTVTVHDIFSRLPVRQKVISETLDFERIRHRICSIALIHPNTAFSLVNESTGVKCLQTHTCRSVLSTFSQLFGNMRSKCLQEVMFEHDRFKVSGFVSTATHHSKSLQFLYVNGRLLLKTKIHKLVNSLLWRSELLKRLPVTEAKERMEFEGPRTAASPRNVKIGDKYGVFILNISCPVKEYDICLDPTKTLIEFQDWEKVFYCIEKCIGHFLTKHNLVLKPDTSEEAVTSKEESVNSCCNSFEYKKRIDTGNVKMSLHSSTVSRPNTTEKEEASNQEKCRQTSQRDSASPLCNTNQTASSDAIAVSLGVCNNALINSEDVGIHDTYSVLKDSEELLVTHSTLHLDTEPKLKKPKQSKQQDEIVSETPTASASWTSSTSGCATSQCVESREADTCMNKSNYCSFDQGTSASKSYYLSAQSSISRKIPVASYEDKKGHNFSKWKYDSNIDNDMKAMELSSVGTGSETLKRKQVAGTTFLTTSYGSNSFPVSDQSTPSSPHRAAHQTPSDSSALLLPIRTHRIVDSEKSQSFPTFTSPSPITLQRLLTRKRPQSGNGRGVTDFDLESKTKTYISLQGTNCRRLKCNRSSEKSFRFRNGGCSIQAKNTEGVTQGLDGTCHAQPSDVYDKSTQVCTPTKSDTSLFASKCNGAVCNTIPCTDSSHCDNYGVLDSISTQLGSSLDATTCSTVGNNPVSSDTTLRCMENSDQVCRAQDMKNFSQQDSSEELFSPLASHSEYSVLLSKSQSKDKQSGEAVICAAAAVPNSKLPTYSWKNETGGMKQAQVEKCSVTPGSICTLDKGTSDKHEKHSKTFCHNARWLITFDSFHNKRLYIDRQTGHSFFEPPSELDMEENCLQSAKESQDDERECVQHVPHPCAPHLSFSCTPWLPREERRKKGIESDEKNEDSYKSQLIGWYKEHVHEKETVEKLCKWTGAEAMVSYEQNLLKCEEEKRTVAQLLDSWENPVFAAPEKDILKATQETGNRKQVAVHNVIHPYRFSQDMFMNMTVINQLDDKFIVAVVPDNKVGTERDGTGLLVLVDQHAAHERVRLEQLQADLFENGCDHGGTKPRMKSSPVSPPLEFSLFFEEVHLLQQYRSEVERIGIRFMIGQSSEFSGVVSIVVFGLPSVFVEREVSEVKRGRPSVAVSIVKELIKDHLEHLRSTCGVSAVIPRVITRVISSQACHGAVKFGEPLGMCECQELIKCLSKCKLPFQCAHGRPSVIPLVDLKFLGHKTPSENVPRPMLNKLRETSAAD